MNIEPNFFYITVCGIQVRIFIDVRIPYPGDEECGDVTVVLTPDVVGTRLLEFGLNPSTDKMPHRPYLREKSDAPETGK